MFHGFLSIWLVVDLPLWQILVSWGYEIPNWMESHKNMFQTTNQIIDVTPIKQILITINHY